MSDEIFNGTKKEEKQKEFEVLCQKLVDVANDLIAFQKRDGFVLFFEDWLDNNHCLLLLNHSDDYFITESIGQVVFDSITLYKKLNPHLKVVK